MDEQLKTLLIEGVAFETRLTAKFERRKPYVPVDPTKIHCVIPGVIRKVHVHPGAAVLPGDKLLVLEAMKMENDIVAHVGGKIRTVHVAPGDVVMKGQLLVVIEG
jgi:glutaconyl-CoA/methylmalonyl-CoA decarboxylase subunit gamma